MSAQTYPSLDFALTVASAGGRTVVTTSGEVDAATAPMLREALMRAQAALLRQGPNGSLVVDLAGATFLDASALGVLAGAARRARRVGDELVLRGPTRLTVRLLAITGLLPIFRVVREDHEETTVATGAIPDRDVA